MLAHSARGAAASHCETRPRSTPPPTTLVGGRPSLPPPPPPPPDRSSRSPTADRPQSCERGPAAPAEMPIACRRCCRRCFNSFHYLHIEHKSQLM
ncbi:unnamed protein product, partial [Iphiclides podalirius]